MDLLVWGLLAWLAEPLVLVEPLSWMDLLVWQVLVSLAQLFVLVQGRTSSSWTEVSQPTALAIQPGTRDTHTNPVHTEVHTAVRCTANASRWASRLKPVVS